MKDPNKQLRNLTEAVNNLYTVNGQPELTTGAPSISPSANDDPNLEDDYNRLRKELDELMDRLENCHSFDCPRILKMIQYFYDQLCGLGFTQYCGGYTPGDPYPPVG